MTAQHSHAARDHSRSEVQPSEGSGRMKPGVGRRKPSLGCSFSFFHLNVSFLLWRWPFWDSIINIRTLNIALHFIMAVITQRMKWKCQKSTGPLLILRDTRERTGPGASSQGGRVQARFIPPRTSLRLSDSQWRQNEDMVKYSLEGICPAPGGVSCSSLAH